MPSVIIPLAPGAEEMEAVIIIDTLRRANIEVTVAGLNNEPVTASRGVRILPDCCIDDCHAKKFDAIVLPGGQGGMESLRSDQRVINLLQTMHKEGKWVAAMCAAPLVLQHAGLIKGKNITSYPSLEENLSETNWLNQAVVIDEKTITSQGPGTSFLFALELVANLTDTATATAIAKGLLVEFENN